MRLALAIVQWPGPDEQSALCDCGQTEIPSDGISTHSSIVAPNTHPTAHFKLTSQNGPANGYAHQSWIEIHCHTVCFLLCTRNTVPIRFSLVGSKASVFMELTSCIAPCQAPLGNQRPGILVGVVQACPIYTKCLSSQLVSPRAHLVLPGSQVFGCTQIKHHDNCFRPSTQSHLCP